MPRLAVPEAQGWHDPVYRGMVAMGPGAWLWDQRGDKATRGHKYDRNMSPDQGTSGSPRAAVPEVPKTPRQPPSPKSPPLAEVLLAPGLWRPPGTGVALPHLELLALHNRSCPSVQPRTPCVLTLLGEHHPRQPKTCSSGRWQPVLCAGSASSSLPSSSGAARPHNTHPAPA